LNKSIILPPGRGYLLKPTHTVIETEVDAVAGENIVDFTINN
jgi:hypothetical protein